VAQNTNPYESALQHPPAGTVSFNGTRLDVNVNDLIQTMGRRTPDYTVAQRRFRFAFILVVPQGSTPDTTQIEAYRQQFAQYYATAADGNAAADTNLSRSMKLSLYPAAGVVAGTSATATLTLKTAPAAELAVALQTQYGRATLPASVTIPAGAITASFTVKGVTTGVEEVTATPAGGYETAFASVQVADPSTLKLATVSGDNQPSPTGGPLPNPVVVRLTDINNLSYIGAPIAASASAGGSVTPSSVATDAQGQASFLWTPGSAGASQLTLTLDQSAPAVNVTVSLGAAAPAITLVENAASGAAGVAAGSLVSIEGLNLAGGHGSQGSPQGDWPYSLGGVSVGLGGTPLQLFFVSDTKIGVYAPADLADGAAALTVTTPSGNATATVNVAALQPAIFPGGVLLAGTPASATTTAVHAGDYIEIYGTGLGPTTSYLGLQQTVTIPTVFVGPTPAAILFSGLAPGFLGLNQVDVKVPSGLAPGPQPVMISVNGLSSNTVNILVQ
jgi:uncharacterized protein (TIGR03437 family)